LTKLIFIIIDQKCFEIWYPDKDFDEQKWVVFSGTLLWLSPSLNLQDLSLPILTVCPKHASYNGTDKSNLKERITIMT
jgi:hypothetical protein